MCDNNSEFIDTHWHCVDHQAIVSSWCLAIQSMPFPFTLLLFAIFDFVTGSQTMPNIVNAFNEKVQIPHQIASLKKTFQNGYDFHSTASKTPSITNGAKSDIVSIEALY